MYILMKKILNTTVAMSENTYVPPKKCSFSLSLPSMGVQLAELCSHIHSLASDGFYYRER